MHALEYLKQPEQHPVRAIVVAHGAERFLRQQVVHAVVRQVLGEEAEEAGITRLDGRTADLATLLDELRTVSMWSDRRLVLLEEAEDFVSEHRSALEKYVEKPAKRSVLLIDIKSWPKNTRLYKAIAQSGLEIDCAALKPAEAIRWLVDEAKSRFGRQLMRDAAQLMVELVGPQVGLLTQELAKVAAYVGERPRIEVEDVSTLVGGWKLETTWAMLDALQAGDLPLALTLLDKLLNAGEAPLLLFGGMTFTFRKLAQATELARTGRALNDALADAGVFGHKIAANAAYLRRIGRGRAEKIYPWLLAADADLKRRRLPERVVLERLLVNLSGIP